MFVIQYKEHAELIGWIYLFCWIDSSICTTLVELGELGRFSASMKKLEKCLKNTNKNHNEECRAKLKKSNERSLALIKVGMDIMVAVGLLQWPLIKLTHVSPEVLVLSALSSLVIRSPWTLVLFLSVPTFFGSCFI